jgi:DNA-binding transcriptional regulator GbsR (MarR family)
MTPQKYKIDKVLSTGWIRNDEHKRKLQEQAKQIIKLIKIKRKKWENINAPPEKIIIKIACVNLCKLFENQIKEKKWVKEE